MLTEVATYFPELNLCVFEWVCFVFNDDSASTDTGQFDFLPSTYVRSQYKKNGFVKFDLYILYLLPKAVNWCPEGMNSTKQIVSFGN